MAVTSTTEAVVYFQGSTGETIAVPVQWKEENEGSVGQIADDDIREAFQLAIQGRKYLQDGFTPIGVKIAEGKYSDNSKPVTETVGPGDPRWESVLSLENSVLGWIVGAAIETFAPAVTGSLEMVGTLGGEGSDPLAANNDPKVLKGKPLKKEEVKKLEEKKDKTPAESFLYCVVAAKEPEDFFQLMIKEMKAHKINGIYNEDVIKLWIDGKANPKVPDPAKEEAFVNDVIAVMERNPKIGSDLADKFYMVHQLITFANSERNTQERFASKGKEIIDPGYDGDPGTLSRGELVSIKRGLAKHYGVDYEDISDEEVYRYVAFYLNTVKFYEHATQSGQTS